MGDNASASWAWHNTVVGQGYQAKGVVRQPGSNPVKVVSLKAASPSVTLPAVSLPTKLESEGRKDDELKSKKRKKERSDSKDRKDDHKKKSKKSEKKEKKEKKHKKKHSSSKDKAEVDPSTSIANDVKDNFNPLLQYFAVCISNRTRVFSLANE